MSHDYATDLCILSDPTLSRKKVQTLAKKYNIRANQTTQAMKTQLLTMFTKVRDIPIGSKSPAEAASPSVSPKEAEAAASPSVSPKEAEAARPEEPTLLAAVLAAIDHTANAPPDSVLVGDIVMTDDGRQGRILSMVHLQATVVILEGTRRTTVVLPVATLKRLERPMPPSAAYALNQTS